MYGWIVEGMLLQLPIQYLLSSLGAVDPGIDGAAATYSGCSTAAVTVITDRRRALKYLSTLPCGKMQGNVIEHTN